MVKVNLEKPIPLKEIKSVITDENIIFECVVAKIDYPKTLKSLENLSLIHISYYDFNRVIIEKLVDTLGFHYKDFKIEVVRMEVDIPKIKTLQEQAYEKLRKAFNSRKIPIEWFSRQDLIDMKPNYV